MQKVIGFYSFMTLETYPTKEEKERAEKCYSNCLKRSFKNPGLKAIAEKAYFAKRHKQYISVILPRINARIANRRKALKKVNQQIAFRKPAQAIDIAAAIAQIGGKVYIKSH